MDNELLLIDRLGVIRDTINSYGEENFYLSFSGGKDSTVLHHLLDMALPGNKIPRVFINTGIEYLSIVEFVKELAKDDERVVIVKSSKNIKEVLETYGYPFKSKHYAQRVQEYQATKRISPHIQRYLDGINEDGTTSFYKCPDILKYQFTEENKLKISALCCEKLKKEPSRIWQKETGRSITITGMRAEEGGHRKQLGCITTNKDGNIKKFHPLVKVTDDWENWFIDQYKIELCALYNEPYNFERTGCKGCPFALHLADELEIIQKYLPAERKQCEYIWKPVYAEYRRLGYRLKKDEQLKLF